MLTSEQSQALDALLAHLPAGKPAEKTVTAGGTAPVNDWLQTWLGISTQDLSAWGSASQQWQQQLLERLRAWQAADPFSAAWQFLGAVSLAFFTAEKGHNPRIRTYIDAFYYISTCASVGYADVFPVTQTGKALASLVMMVGPAIAASTLNAPTR